MTACPATVDWMQSSGSFDVCSTTEKMMSKRETRPRNFRACSAGKYLLVTTTLIFNPTNNSCGDKHRIDTEYQAGKALWLSWSCAAYPGTDPALNDELGLFQLTNIRFDNTNPEGHMNTRSSTIRNSTMGGLACQNGEDKRGRLGPGSCKIRFHVNVLVSLRTVRREGETEWCCAAPSPRNHWKSLDLDAIYTAAQRRC